MLLTKFKLRTAILWLLTTSNLEQICVITLSASRPEFISRSSSNSLTVFAVAVRCDALTFGQAMRKMENPLANARPNSA